MSVAPFRRRAYRRSLSLQTPAVTPIAVQAIWSLLKLQHDPVNGVILIALSSQARGVRSESHSVGDGAFL
jgi:hypothetical protein